MERYVAIDNVCAWPNLTQLPGGVGKEAPPRSPAIVATIFNQPCHGLWEGDVETWASEDGGRFWRLRGTPAPHEPGTNRMNVAAGLAANGDLVVLASGWSHRPRKGAGRAGHDPPAHPLLPWICRSGDGGRTWTQTEAIQPPDGGHAIPFGDIVRLPDGALGACIYSYRPPEHRACSFYTSADDGRTWAVRGVIRAHNISETTPLVLPNGELLACGRTRGDQHLELFRSKDGGANWRFEQAVTSGAQHPGHLLNLADGRVLLTYGDRREGHQGIEARLSADAGQTWSAPARLVELEPTDLGYPSAVQRDDGAIVSAWYCRGIAAHQRYHMGVAIWTLDELFPQM